MRRMRARELAYKPPPWPKEERERERETLGEVNEKSPEENDSGRRSVTMRWREKERVSKISLFLDEKPLNL